MMSTFAEDMSRGLSAPQKHTSSKYFYDDRGSQLFQAIMEMPEYYLPNCEFEILQEQSPDIVAALDFTEHFNIVELGAGDGLKTYHLLRYLVNAGFDFTYLPVDISSEAMKQLQAKLQRELPDLKIEALVGDYFQILGERLGVESSPNLLLFLGSNIGNYHPAEARDLLQRFHRAIRPGDKLLLGVDLQKNPNIIRRAYNDAAGITRSFNLNLLERMNRELGANFVVEQFDFYCSYNPQNGEVRSYLVSLCAQQVQLGPTGPRIAFGEHELIATELSRKYTYAELEQLAGDCGFRVASHFRDRRGYFTDSLWVRG